MTLFRLPASITITHMISILSSFPPVTQQDVCLYLSEVNLCFGIQSLQSSQGPHSRDCPLTFLGSLPLTFLLSSNIM